MMKNILKVVMIVFGLFLLYQIVHKLLGGSWSIEQLILATAVLNLGWTMSLQKDFSHHLGEHKMIDYRLSGMDHKISRI